MLTPILRLLVTYLAVGLAVFAFFNRDRLAEMMGWGNADTPSAIAAAEQGGETGATTTAPAAEIAPPVFAPPPGDNGVPVTAAAPVAQPAPATPTAPSSPALQTPTPPAGASTAGVLQTPVAPVAPAVQAPSQPAQIQPEDSLETMIAAARNAYWQGDTPTAIARYGDLLKEYPDSEALHGELGNIYYMNGNRVEAATHYEAAGMAALKDGNRQQAQMLLGVLGSLDRAAAARLQKAMEGNQ